MKNSQVIGEIFIYILAILLFSLIMLYGYNSIKSLGEKADTVILLQMEKHLSSSVKKIASDYGTVIKEELVIPNQYDKVCFIDLSYTGQQSTNICLLGNNDYNPVICNSWKDKISKNMFLISKNFDVSSMGVGNIKISNSHYFCQNVIFGKVILRLEGRGSYVELSGWI